MIKSFFIIAFLFSASVSAQWNQSVAAGYRSVPAGQNIQATVAYDKILWGEFNRNKPMYGYMRAGVKAGGAPTGAAFVQVSPIAPFIIEFQKSATYRYTPSPIFNCNSIFCFGVTERTDVTAKLAFGIDNLVGYASYLWRDIELPHSSNAVLAETELMTGQPGSHIYNEFSVAAGIKFEENFAGILYSQGVFSENNKRSKSAYVVYSWKYDGFDLTAGVGAYETDEPNVDGTGLILAISKRFGESLSLF